MRKRIIYGILKTYKGIFTKKHIGNVQILIIEMEKSFWVLNLLGQMEDGKQVAQLLLRAPSEYVEEFIDTYEKSENFMFIEELFCDISNENISKLKILLKKKGKHINTHLNINHSIEYSKGNVNIYIIDGKFNLIMDDIKLDSPIKSRMSALKNQSIINPLLSKFLTVLKG
jgi:hypothetical protein